MINSTKKIVFAVHSLCAGGQERVISVLINEFIKFENVEIHLVMFGKEREIFYSLPSQTVIHKPEFVFNNKLRMINSVKTMLFVRKKLSSLNPDAILSFGEYWNNFVLLSCIGKKLPIFVSDRNQPDKLLTKLQEFLRKLLYPKAKGIIAQTEIAKTVLYSKTKHPHIRVIGNPISKFANVSTEKQNIVLTVGRLIKSKHHAELIKLFSEIKFNNWKLIIVGDDAIKQQNRAKLEELVVNLSATDYIELAGKRTDVENYYAKSKIFAFTSSSEGFPNVIGEAMSAGLPVVSFNCIAGPAEMVHHGENGYLVPLFDYETFKTTLLDLMKNELLIDEMGKNAKNSIAEFDSMHIARKFYNFMTENNLQ